MVWVSTSKSFNMAFSCIHVTTLLLGSLLHHTLSGCLPSFCMQFSFCSRAPCIQPHNLCFHHTHTLTHTRMHALTYTHTYCWSLNIHENMVTCLSGSGLFNHYNDLLASIFLTLSTLHFHGWLQFHCLYHISLFIYLRRASRQLSFSGNCWVVQL